MNQTKHNQQNPLTPSLCVRLNPEKLNHLAEPTKSKASRLDAYLYLLHIAEIATATQESFYGQTSDPEAACFVISITDLAKQCHWSRETVRKFLDQLAVCGLLAKTQVGGRTIVTMTTERDDAKQPSILEKPQTPFEMPDQLYYKIDEWLIGIIDNSELADIIEETVASFDRTNEDAYSQRVTAFQYSLIQQLIPRWFVNAPAVPEVADSYSLECLKHIFSECLSDNWSEWLNFLDKYCPGLNRGSSLVEPSTDPGPIKSARYAYYALFIHLKVDFIYSWH